MTSATGLEMIGLPTVVAAQQRAHSNHSCTMRRLSMNGRRSSSISTATPVFRLPSALSVSTNSASSKESSNAWACATLVLAAQPAGSKLAGRQSGRNSVVHRRKAARRYSQASLVGTCMTVSGESRRKSGGELGGEGGGDEGGEDGSTTA